MANVIYNKFKSGLLQGSYNLTTLPIWVSLVNGTYTPNIDTDLYATTPLVYQVVGTGYTSPGLALSGPNILQDDTGDRGILYGTTIRWDALTASVIKGCVLWGSSGGGMASDPLIAYFDFTTERAVTAGTLTIEWNAAGILNIT